MGSIATSLNSYRKFLESIPLQELGEETRPVKTVEPDWREDLNLNIWKTIYTNYWEKGNFLSFDKWFGILWAKLESGEILKEFEEYCEAFLKYYRKNQWRTLTDDWFKTGFRARLFRLWTSALTQLDFCYVFMYICEKQDKEMSLQANAELDARGVNLRVGALDFQIAKISERSEARRGRPSKVKIDVPYPVWNLQELERLSQSTRVSLINQQRYKNQLNAFHKYFLLLNNGFVVFSEHYVEQVVSNLSNPEKLKAVIERLLAELSGEYAR
jgi:hypothetical protein